MTAPQPAPPPAPQLAPPPTPERCRLLLQRWRGELVLTGRERDGLAGEEGG